MFSPPGCRKKVRVYFATYLKIIVQRSSNIYNLITITFILKKFGFPFDFLLHIFGKFHSRLCLNYCKCLVLYSDCTTLMRSHICFSCNVSFFFVVGGKS